MNETIDGIVREMREVQVWDLPGQIGRLADRIEAAYKSQLTDGTMCTMSCRTDGELLEQYAESEKRLVAEVAKLRNELAAGMRTCERLRAALKPVLDCPCDEKTSVWKAAHNCMTAVADATRIWRTGGEA